MNTIEKLLETEWEMFHNVNGEDRTSCQDDFSTFCAMRRAQYDVWSEKTVESYYHDLLRAKEAGVNLLRQKYIYMMKTTDPEGFAHFSGELPETSAEAAALVEEIWSYQLRQTVKMREKYPVIALGGRPLYASEETEWPSIETYQKSELRTYSEQTLKSLLEDIRALDAQGIDYAFQVQKNSVLCMGYQTMEEAETALALQILAEFGAEPGGCSCCGGGDGC